MAASFNKEVVALVYDLRMLFCGFGDGREDKMLTMRRSSTNNRCKRRAMNLFSIDLSDLVKNNKNNLHCVNCLCISWWPNFGPNDLMWNLSLLAVVV
jgi:hypothetical protein